MNEDDVTVAQSRKSTRRRTCFSRTCTRFASWRRPTTRPTVSSWVTSSGTARPGTPGSVWTSACRTSTSCRCTKTSTTTATTTSSWPTRTSAPRRRRDFDERSRRSAGARWLRHSGVARLWSQGEHRGSDGRKSPSGVQGGEGLEARTLEARYVQTICSCQMLFYSGLLPSLSSISPYTSSPENNSSDLRESHDPTRPGQGGKGFKNKNKKINNNNNADGDDDDDDDDDVRLSVFRCIRMMMLVLSLYLADILFQTTTVWRWRSTRTERRQPGRTSARRQLGTEGVVVTVPPSTTGFYVEH